VIQNYFGKIKPRGKAKKIKVKTKKPIMEVILHYMLTYCRQLTQKKAGK
jgi:hypothetical protein